MNNWPPDLPPPTVDEIRAAVIASCGMEQWPATNSQSPANRIVRLICANLCRSLRSIRGQELAEAAGYRTHGSMYRHDAVRAFVDSPAGLAVRMVVLRRLIGLRRGVKAGGGA